MKTVWLEQEVLLPVPFPQIVLLLEIRVKLFAVLQRKEKKHSVNY